MVLQKATYYNYLALFHQNQKVNVYHTVTGDLL